MADRQCEWVACQKQPYFALDMRDAPKFCYMHKSDIHVDVRKKRYHCCIVGEQSRGREEEDEKNYRTERERER